MMKFNETGRSMVEMLGVLAIIGVLSVGGIAGYNTAMKRYKANEVVNTATMLSMMAQSADGGAGKNIASLSDAGLTPPVSGVSMSANSTGGVTVSGAGNDICGIANAAIGNSRFGFTCS